MAETLLTNNAKQDDEDAEEGKARMAPDMKTMAAIMRLLDKHDSATANDIMEYVSKRAKRLAMLDEAEARR